MRTMGESWLTDFVLWAFLDPRGAARVIGRPADVDFCFPLARAVERDLRSLIPLSFSA